MEVETAEAQWPQRFLQAVSSLRPLCLCGSILAAVLAVPLGCGGHTATTQVAAPEHEARWQDVIDITPELLVVVRPKALRKDKVYGPLLSRAIDALRQRSRVVAATRVLDAIDDADEVIGGVRPDPIVPGGEMVVVVRGVRADIDPAKVVDPSGHVIWAPGPHGAVPELTRDRDDLGQPLAVSLFELPGRTWVIAAGGAARERAREAYAHPVGRAAFQLDPDALVVVRVDGQELVKNQPGLQRYGQLEAIGHKLRWVVFTLPPGGEGVVKAQLTYVDEDSASFAEARWHDVVDAIGRTKPPKLLWMTSLKIDRTGKYVLLSAPLPPQLLDGLLHAGQAALSE
jgi:hypothetical protein